MQSHMPNTPFSTRFFGSAKETELRLRSIFQWEKKRPPVAALAVAALVVVLCGSLVGFTTPEPEEPSVDEPVIEGTKPVADPKSELVQNKETATEEGPRNHAGQTEDMITDYFSRKLSEISPDTPLVIAERQTFDWNGTTATAVTATNIVVTDFEADLLRADAPHPEPNPPARENTVMYLMSALFVDGHEPIDLMYDEVHGISKVSLGQDALGVSYDYGQEVSFQQFLSVIQYENGEVLATCPVFCTHAGELVTRDYKYHPSYALEDADGDGEVEFVFFRDRSSSLYAKYAVYDWADGSVQRTEDVLEQYQNPVLGVSEPERNEESITAIFG